MNQELLKNKDIIIQKNKIDIEKGIKKGLSKALLDRLSLNEKRIIEMADGLKAIEKLKDPLGEVIEKFRRPNGLIISKIRVPIGVIGIIYEARPNVTLDAAALCLKTSNAVILRGSSSAINSNKIIVKVLQNALKKAGINKNAIHLIYSTDRKTAARFMKMNKYIDLLIPRGGAGLIKYVIKESTIPVLETGVGNCHLYIDEYADIKKALDITINAKTQRPSVCNAIETLLIHKNVARKFIPMVFKELKNKGVEIRGCIKTKKIDKTIKITKESDWHEEYLDLKLAVKIVDNIKEAVDHIYKYGTKHTEGIVTNNKNHAEYFINNIDAAAIMINASTRFTDGGQFGYGAEMGISTQKLHARGPVGLKELTSYKYIVLGNGQIRK
jgi:glutamate-5-semialdehyde dehydrogenase